MGVPYPPYRIVTETTREAVDAYADVMASDGDFGIELSIRRLAEAGDEQMIRVLKIMRQDAFDAEMARWKEHPWRSFVRAEFGGFEWFGVVSLPIMCVVAPFLIAWNLIVVMLEDQASEINK